MAPCQRSGGWRVVVVVVLVVVANFTLTHRRKPRPWTQDRLEEWGVGDEGCWVEGGVQGYGQTALVVFSGALTAVHIREGV